jgi:hypothetical protein
MSERRATGYTLILPFSIGMAVGGAGTGWMCAALGFAENLGEGADCFWPWLNLVVLTVVFGSLVEFLVLKRVSLLLPLSVRLTATPLVACGIVAAFVATIASCMTIDLRKIPFEKGPSILFPFFLFPIQAIATLLLVKRATSQIGESDHNQDANEAQQEAEDKDAE